MIFLAISMYKPLCPGLGGAPVCELLLYYVFNSIDIYKYKQLTPLNWFTSGSGHFEPINRCSIKRSRLYYYYLVEFKVTNEWFNIWLTKY